MRKVFKTLIALGVTASFIIFSVLCCCTASAVMAHIHKVSACSHCPEQNTSDHPSKSSETCQRQFISAEFNHGHIIAAQVSASAFIPYLQYLEQYKTPVIPAIVLSYPPGGSPLGVSLIPLYLRTCNLRI